MSDGPVSLNIDKATMMDMLKRAASQKRTVYEFRTVEIEDGKQLDSVIDITDHVESLEE